MLKHNCERPVCISIELLKGSLTISDLDCETELCRFVGDKSRPLCLCGVFNAPQHQTDWRIDFLLHSFLTTTL